MTETFNQQLHRLDLGADGVTLSIYGHMIPYRFSGFGGPDSAMIDDDDNVYVAYFGAGKVMVFNLLGNLIGQILIPGRDTGYMLSTTTMAIIPGTNELIIGAGDFSGRGARIFKARTFGKVLGRGLSVPEPGRAARETCRRTVFCSARRRRRRGHQQLPESLIESSAGSSPRRATTSSRLGTTYSLRPSAPCAAYRSLGRRAPAPPSGRLSGPGLGARPFSDHSRPYAGLRLCDGVTAVSTNPLGE